MLFGVGRNGILFGCIILIIIPNGCESGFRADRPRPRRSATLAGPPGKSETAPDMSSLGLDLPGVPPGGRVSGGGAR